MNCPRLCAWVLSSGVATQQDVFDVMRLVQQRTGDPAAWQSGLTPGEMGDVLSPATPPQRLDVILAKIRHQHPDLFTPAPAPQAPPQRSEGEAASAISAAETALAHQNSASSQLDLQVVTAILNAHLTNAEGRTALDALQHEIETALATRSDLDTPAGARDFQRFLISKLRDIRAVVATAGLDDTSKSALMAAWTSLYNASKAGPDAPAEHRPAAAEPATGHGGPPAASSSSGPAAKGSPDPLLDSTLLDDPGLFDAPVQQPAAAAPLPVTGAGGAAPTGVSPSSGAGAPSWGAPSGFSVPNLSGGGTGRDPRGASDGLFDEDFDPREHRPDDDETEREKDDHDDPRHEPEPGEPQPQPSGPTTVSLPNGETVTAASPQLAAAIKAAAAGAPIADAFQQQGMSIPPPGTAVTNPLDPAQVVPGDIGMLTDRHALALGNSKALLDGQIQRISAVSGPSFLGWEHPPTPVQATVPSATQTPTPTRPAAVAG